MRVVKVETMYFRENVKDAAPVINELVRVFRGIFPKATQLDVKFEGVNDLNKDIARQEKRSRKLWREAKLSKFACDKFVMSLLPKMS